MIDPVVVAALFGLMGTVTVALAGAWFRNRRSVRDQNSQMRREAVARLSAQRSAVLVPLREAVAVLLHEVSWAVAVATIADLSSREGLHRVAKIDGKRLSASITRVSRMNLMHDDQEVGRLVDCILEQVTAVTMLLAQLIESARSVEPRSREIAQRLMIFRSSRSGLTSLARQLNARILRLIASGNGQLSPVA